MKWKIFYSAYTDTAPGRSGGFPTYSSEDGPPELAPCTGVLVIAEIYQPTGRILHDMQHYYWFEDGHWHSGNDAGFYTYMMRPGLKIVKFGETVDNDTWVRVKEVADTDPDFPRRQSYLKRENRSS